MTMQFDRINQERHKLSAIVALGWVGLVFSLAQALKTPAEIAAQEAIELTTSLIEPLVEKTLPTLPASLPKEIKTRNIPQPPQPAPTPAQEVVKEVSSQEPFRAVQAPAQNLQQTPQSISEPPKPAQQLLTNSATIENSYTASVRALLNANKRYPTGRDASLQRPAGKVKIGFLLTRNGSLLDASVDESSNSIILDNAALATVRRTTYAAWPDGSWPSQSQHKFTVLLDFVPLN